MTTLRKEPVSKLGIQLQNYRADRPDEWTMDEFTRKAEAMNEQNLALKAALEKIIKLDEAIHSFEDGVTQICDVAFTALEGVGDE